MMVNFRYGQISPDSSGITYKFYYHGSKGSNIKKENYPQT